MPLDSITPSKLARLLETQAPQMAIVVLDSNPAQFATEMTEEMQIRPEFPFKVFEGPFLTSTDLLKAIAASPGQQSYISSLDQLSEADFQHLDQNRSRLLNAPCLILAMTSPAAGRFLGNAPNIRSVVGASIFQGVLGDSALTPDEVEARLIALREHFNRTDQSIIAEAEAKTLELDSEHVEWLILAGRGDLVP